MKIEIDMQKILAFLKPHWIIALATVMLGAASFTVFFIRYVAFIASVSFGPDMQTAQFVISLCMSVVSGLVYLGMRFKWMEA